MEDKKDIQPPELNVLVKRLITLARKGNLIHGFENAHSDGKVAQRENQDEVDPCAALHL